MSDLETLCRDLLKTADQVGANNRAGQRTLIKYLQNPFLPRLRALLKGDQDDRSQPPVAPSGGSPIPSGFATAEAAEAETGLHSLAGLEGTAATVLLAEDVSEE